MRSIGWRIAGSFGVVLVLLSSIGILAFLSIRSLNSDIQWVIHTHLVIENLDEILSLLTDAETGQRGFLITGQHAYLGPYTSAITQVRQRLQTVYDLTHDNPQQQARLVQLTALIQRKLDELRLTIVLRQGPGGFQAARTVVLTNRGKQIMDGIRVVVTAMEQDEQSLLTQRSMATQASIHDTILVIAVGIPVAFLIVGLLAFVITRSIAVPLGRLTATAEQIAAGQINTKVPEVRRRDEIGVLQQSFRKMQERVTERNAALETSNEALRRSEEQFRLMVESVKDYAIILLDTAGHIINWNVGAERIKGYRADEILGKSFSIFYTPEDIATGKPQYELEQALTNGRFEDEWWRVRKDGSRFWANVNITPLYTAEGTHFGFVKVTRDISERRRAEVEMQALNADLLQRTAALEVAVKELEGFSYSVAHDLRSPLRSLDGFSKYLLEHSRERLNAQEQDYLYRMRMAAQRMARLIDDLLDLARVGRTPMHIETVNLSELATDILAGLRRRDPQRQVITTIAPAMLVQGDRGLLQIALEHLLENAWKFTSIREEARITFDMIASAGERVFRVQDNGAGFNMAYADKLFHPFQRLHTEEEFPGTGIGLALIQRIVQRHGGRIWTEAIERQGATFYFTLGEDKR